MVEFSIVECTGKPMETPSKDRKIFVHFPMQDTAASGSRSVGTGTPHSPSSNAPAQRDNHPFFSESRHAGRTAPCPNVFSTGSGPKPRLIFPAEFWWWDHYSASTDMSTSAGPSHIGVG